MRTKQTQRGVASIEAILVMPLLLFFVLAGISSVQLVLLKERNIIETRTSAMRNALLGVPCVPMPRRRPGGWLLGTTCSQSQRFSSDYIGDLRRGGGHSRRFADEFRRAGLPPVVTATGNALFRSSTQTGSALIRIKDQYAVADARMLWLREDLPSGHDRYLRSKIRSRHLFPDFFPRLR